MRTSTLRASKASSSLWKLFAAILLVWLLIPVGQVSAQNSGTLKAYWKFSRPDGTHGQLNLFCAASGAEGNEITDWAKPGWQHTGAFHQKDIETVVIEESFKNALPTSCKEWFDGCSYLTKIEGIENLNTEEVTDMSGMFYECAMLKSIDHSKFNTTKVKTMKNMFYGFGSYVDVSNPFNTVRPTLDLSHFNTSSVLDMEGMFANCSLIKKLDVSCFNTSNVTSMRAMFGGCAYLSELNLKGFSTTATTDMANMFDQCYSLTQLDLSSFTITDKLKDTEHMFKDCMSLSSIYANDWSDLLVSIKTDNMFDGCNELVGAVAFEASKLNGDMANGQTGYFMPRYTDGNDKVTYFEKNENNQIVLNLYNANPFVVTTAYNIDKGTYTRQNMPSNWGTVCVPFIIDVTNAETNCEIYKFHAVEGENLYIEKVAKGEIAAGTPVIVKGKGADLKVCSPERNHQLNRERQALEQQIWEEASAIACRYPPRMPLVLASDSWHQGVIGIAASRLSEEFHLPTIMICCDGERGKGSCRSFGGFNLYNALSACSEYLEGFGGHALAAGLTIRRENIDRFRRALGEYYRQNPADDLPELTCDLRVNDPHLLTMPCIESLDALEPCGNGNPKPLLCITGARLVNAVPIGGGRHLRLHFAKGGYNYAGIFFSCTPAQLGVRIGQWVDVAFTPQINEFRGRRSVQLLVTDVRPSDPLPLCRALLKNQCIPAWDTVDLYPLRADFAVAWRWLNAPVAFPLEELPARAPMRPEKFCVCLRVMAEMGLAAVDFDGETLRLRPLPTSGKVDLGASKLLQTLRERRQSLL